MTEQEAIDVYKRDFYVKFGKCLKAYSSEKWEEVCKIHKVVSDEQIIELVLRATKWNKDVLLTKRRLHTHVFARSLVFFIMINNGIRLTDIARKYGYHHSSIVYIKQSFQNLLETNPSTGKLLKKVVDYINEFA